MDSLRLKFRLYNSGVSLYYFLIWSNNLSNLYERKLRTVDNSWSRHIKSFFNDGHKIINVRIETISRPQIRNTGEKYVTCCEVCEQFSQNLYKLGARRNRHKKFSLKIFSLWNLRTLFKADALYMSHITHGNY